MKRFGWVALVAAWVGCYSAYDADPGTRRDAGFDASELVDAHVRPDTSVVHDTGVPRDVGVGDASTLPDATPPDASVLHDVGVDGSPSTPTLTVAVRTDFVPVAEFDEVVVTWDFGGVTARRVLPGEDFTTAVVITSVTRPRGPIGLRVALRLAGREVATRSITLTLENDSLLEVHFARPAVPDAGVSDGGFVDAGPRDAGPRDAGPVLDAGPRDAGGDAAPAVIALQVRLRTSRTAGRDFDQIVTTLGRVGTIRRPAFPGEDFRSPVEVARFEVPAGEYPLTLTLQRGAAEVASVTRSVRVVSGGFVVVDIP